MRLLTYIKMAIFYTCQQTQAQKLRGRIAHEAVQHSVFLSQIGFPPLQNKSNHFACAVRALSHQIFKLTGALFDEL
jgi:hypothetical protein